MWRVKDLSGRIQDEDFSDAFTASMYAMSLGLGGHKTLILEVEGRSEVRE